MLREHPEDLKAIAEQKRGNLAKLSDLSQSERMKRLVEGYQRNIARGRGQYAHFFSAFGTDVTIIATSKQVFDALKAADELAKEGIEAEVVDPRTLKPLDTETLLNSVRKTHHCIVVNEGCRTGGYAAEVAATLSELAFGYLDAPILRVTTEDVTIPANLKLEAEAVPQVKDILAAVHQVIGED